MIFIGPNGVGKRTVARAFAGMLLDSQRQDRREEGHRLTIEGSHPDLHLVGKTEDRKNIAVEDIRELCAALHLRPYYGGGHVAIVDDAHEMNSAAYNALLMTLEEPPPECYLILVTDSPQRLPATILSRCQPVHFGELSEAEVQTVLARMVPSFDSDHIATLARFAGGCLEPLDLGGWIDPRTLMPLDRSALEEHLAGISKESVRITKRVREIFTSERGRDPAYVAACIAAQDLGGDKDASALVWRLLLQELRHQLRSNSERGAAWGELLQKTIDSLALTKERNLNLPLQLTTIFAKAAEIAVQ